jgi:hypothetical protein
VTGHESYWRTLKIGAKYRLMKLQRLVYPDVFCIPWWLGAKCDFLRTGASLELDKYDFVFAELNSGVGQLEYLKDLIQSASSKMIILPGPSEIFESYADAESRSLASFILRESGQVWAFSQEVAHFADKYARKEVAKVIPWPFDYDATRQLAQDSRASPDDKIKILVGVPLRFTGIAANEPRFLEDCLAEALSVIPEPDRQRFKFYGMVYTKDDERAWRQTQFGRRIGIVLELKKTYTKFLKFVSGCDAVVTLPKFGVLGRIAFIAAALDKPGIFTKNSELHRRLYSGSLVTNSTDAGLENLIGELLSGLAGSQPLDRFFPDVTAAKDAGDFLGNADKLRALLHSSQSKN